MAPPLTRASRLCAGLAVGLLLLVGLSRPNAAQPDLAPRGWAPGVLLPVTLSPAAVTAVLWTAYLLGALAVYLGLRGRVPPLGSWLVPSVVGLLSLLAAPFGSADHVNYLAYGRILVQGGNPWVEAPLAWAGGLDPVTSRVEEPWTTEPSVYGPFGTLLHGLSALVGGDSLRQGVWVWQLLVVLSWLAVRALLRRLLDPGLHGRVDVLWTLNPLVLGIGVLGAHLDVVAAALAVAAVLPVARRAGWAAAALSGVLVGVAGSTKFTYGVVGAGIVAAWWLGGNRAAAFGRLVGALLGGLVLSAGVLHAWAGPHVYDQVLRSRQAVSLATPWRPVLEWGREAVGNGTVRGWISVAAAVLAVVLAWCLLRLSRPAPAPTLDPAPVPPPPPPPPQLSRPIPEPSPSQRFRTPAKVKVPVPGMPCARRRRSPRSRSGSPGASPSPTRSRRPTPCRGTTCSSGAPCRRCCPGSSTWWPSCGSPRRPSPTCRAASSA